MRVLQVLDYLNYNSGVSAVVSNYYFGINREKIQCDFLIFQCENNEVEKRILEQGAKIYETMHPTIKNMFAYQKKLDEFFDIHGKEYDVIHVHIPVAASMILGRAKKCGIPKRILHSHNAKGADGGLKKVRNYVLNKSGIKYANSFFACSKVAGEYLFGTGKKVVVLPNAIDINKYSFNEQIRKQIRQELGIKDEFLIGHVGRFVEQKNHEGIIMIFKQLCIKNDNCKLLLIGDGELKTQIKSLVAQYKLEDKVIFKGIVNNVYEYMSAMDVFVLPSLYEGLPVVCIEAQSVGLPCIVSTNVTKESQVISEFHFIENEDVERWCEVLLEYYKSKDVERKCYKMPQYDIKEQVKWLEEYYLGNEKSTNIDVNL